MSMQTEYSILGFFTLFIILLNLFSIPYGEQFVKNADFLNSEQRKDYSADGDIWTTLYFLLAVNVPDTSKIFGAIYVYRIVYWTITFPYLVLIGYVIVRLIRG
jgi:hypothetical protein